MNQQKREPQPEHWWKKRTCPGVIVDGERIMCNAGECALWVETRKDDQGSSVGVCTA